MTRRMVLIAVTLAAVAAVAATLLPLATIDTISTTTSRGEGIEHVVAIQASREWDLWILFLIWVPVGVAAVPLLRGSRRFTAAATVGAAVLLTLFVVVAGINIGMLGLLYAPAAVAMMIAAGRALRPAPETIA